MFADTEESIASIYSQNRICLKQYWQMCERGPGQCKASSAWSRTIAALQAGGPGKRGGGGHATWSGEGTRIGMGSTRELGPSVSLYVCLRLGLSVPVIFVSVCPLVCLSVHPISLKFKISLKLWSISVFYCCCLTHFLSSQICVTI